MDEGTILLIESIDRRTAAMREDLQATQNSVHDALAIQDRKFTESLRDILFTTQSIQTTMVKNTDCASCQEKFVTKREIKTIVAVIVAIVGAAEWALSKAGDWWQTH